MLRKIFEIYKQKKQLNEKINAEIITNVTLEEGDIVQIFPSVDGLEMLFLVWNTSEEENLARLMLLSEFTEFATPKDVIVTLDGQNYIVQTDIFLDVPKINPEKFLKRNIFKIGKLPKSELEKIDKVFYGETTGDGKFTTPTKGRFKRSEARRVVKLLSEIL